MGSYDQYPKFVVSKLGNIYRAKTDNYFVYDGYDLSDFLPLTDDSIGAIKMSYPQINIETLKRAELAWKTFNPILCDEYYIWDEGKNRWR